MSLEIIRDVECNKCHSIYKSTDNETMSVVVNHTFLSICPKCTKEVAALMGFTPDTITKELAHIKYVHNREHLEWEMRQGMRCARCEAPFEGHHHKHTIPDRLQDGDFSGIKHTGYYHTSCYEKETAKIQD